MKRKFILIFMVVIAMGMTACSAESKEEISVNTDSRQETDQEETKEMKTADTKTVDTKTTDLKMTETEAKDVEPSKPENAKDDEIDCLEIEEIPQGDPIAGIVDEYDGNTITVRTPEDDMLYHFSAKDVPVLEGYSTESAKAVEGDFQIAVGDKVEVSYRGLLDDEKHPIDAVKIVVVPVE